MCATTTTTTGLLRAVVRAEQSKQSLGATKLRRAPQGPCHNKPRGPVGKNQRKIFKGGLLVWFVKGPPNPDYGPESTSTFKCELVTDSFRFG